MNWKEQVEASDINKLATEYIKEFWSEQPKNIREKLDLSFRSGYLSAIEDAAKERAEIQAAALPVETEEEIKKLAEQEYPTEDARKNMFHDNYGQYERQEAFIKGFKAALPVKEEPVSRNEDELWRGAFDHGNPILDYPIKDIIDNYFKVKPIQQFGLDSTDFSHHIMAVILTLKNNE